MSELAVQVPRVTQQRATLVDLLDRVLGKGVVAYGDVVLSIADLDLVYLNLRAVLSSIGTLESKNGGSWFVDGGSKIPVVSEGAPEPREEAGSGKQKPVVGSRESVATSLPTTHYPLPSGVPSPGKLELDPKKVEQGLAKLVLTLINLLRKLMERQAIRRMEAGTLTPEQLERAGQAFKRLDERMRELREQFGLKEEDLNLDLGPLGELV